MWELSGNCRQWSGGKKDDKVQFKYRRVTTHWPQPGVTGGKAGRHSKLFETTSIHVSTL